MYCVWYAVAPIRTHVKVRVIKGRRNGTDSRRVSESRAGHSVTEAVESPKKVGSETGAALPSIRPPITACYLQAQCTMTKMCPTYCIMALVDRQTDRQQAINFVAVKTAGATQMGKEGRAMLLNMAS